MVPLTPRTEGLVEREDGLTRDWSRRGMRYVNRHHGIVEEY